MGRDYAAASDFHQPRLMTRPNRRSTRRRRGRAAYGDLFETLSAILFRHDPIRINFGSNRDEYDPEAETILARLPGCASVAEAQRMIHGEFVRWFRADLAGSVDKYAALATEIWDLWSRHSERGLPAGTD